MLTSLAFTPGFAVPESPTKNFVPNHSLNVKTAVPKLYGLAGPGFYFPTPQSNVSVIAIDGATGEVTPVGDEWPNHSFSEGSSTLSGSVFSFITLDKTGIDPHTTSLPCLLASQDVTTGAKLPVATLPYTASIFSAGGAQCVTAAADGSGDVFVVSSELGDKPGQRYLSRVSTADGKVDSKLVPSGGAGGPFGVSCAHDPKADKLWFATCSQDASTGKPCSFSAIDTKTGGVTDVLKTDIRCQILHLSYDATTNALVGTGSLSPQCAGEVAVFSAPLDAVPTPAQGQPAPKWTFPVHPMPSDSGGTPYVNVGCATQGSAFTFLSKNVPATSPGVIGADATTGKVTFEWEALKVNGATHDFMMPIALSLEC